MAENTRFWEDVPARTTRRGHFWVPGERVVLDGKTYQRGPLFVEWEAPEQVTQPYPIVLVHGGTLQGTEWGKTPDGRPGWAQRFVEAGYVTLLADRPGHGRSPYHPAVIGPTGPPFSYEQAKEVYFPDSAAAAHTQWPFDPEDEAAYDAFLAPYGPMPADLAASQEMDADRLARLLDRIGPTIVLTHSASGPDGWLVAGRRPGLVVAAVSVEPMGPPFAATPGIGELTWGLTAVPVAYDPPFADAEAVRAADPATLRVPAWAGVPMAVVTGETSSFAQHGPAIVEFLKTAGAAAERLHLPDFGVFGNGHGLIYEKNSDAALRPVLDWLEAKTGKRQAAESPRQVLERFYAAERAYMEAGDAGDFAATIGTTLAQDVVLHQSPDLPWGGEYIGWDRYQEWAVAMSATFSSVDVQDARFFEAGNQVVVVCRLVTRTRSTGDVMDYPMAQVVTVRDGKITDFRPFYWNVPDYVSADRP